MQNFDEHKRPSMSEEILINITPQETRVAVVENGVLQEVFVERASRRGLVGNIYKGRVSPGPAGHAGGIRGHRDGAHRRSCTPRTFKPTSLANDARGAARS